MNFDEVLLATGSLYTSTNTGCYFRGKKMCISIKLKNNHQGHLFLLNILHSCCEVGKDVCQKATYLILQTVCFTIYSVTAGKMVFKNSFDLT